MTPLVLTLLLLAPQDQDPDPDPPPPVPPQVPGVTSGTGTPLLASDDRPVEPGRIPTDTSPAARERWNKLIAATAADALPPITSFDLRFEVTARTRDAYNELDVGVAYLESDLPRAPFVRLFLEREDLVSIHGPEASWLVDGDEVQRMTGRDYAEDLRQLAEYRTLAGNLLALIQPARVRLVSLRALEVMPTTIDAPWASRRISFANADPLDLPTSPEWLAPAARGCEWLEVRSPDLRVHRRGGATAADDVVYRGLFALEVDSGQVKVAVLREERADGSVVPSSALLVLVSGYHRMSNGYSLPRDFEVREIAPESMPLTFESREGTQLWLMPQESAINPPGLTLDTFRPR